MAIKPETIVESLKALAGLLPGAVTILEKRLNWFSINPMVRKGLSEAAIVFSIVSFVVLWYIAGRRKSIAAATLFAGAVLATFGILALTETDLSDASYAPFGVMCTYVLLFTFLGGSLGAAMSRVPASASMTPTPSQTSPAPTQPPTPPDY